MNEELRAAAAAVIEACRARGWKVATAESCTGGLVAATLTEIPGASAVVDRGFVTYSNKAKKTMLGVSARTLKKHGAVSRECAAEMAKGALKRSQAHIVVSITGVAGPGPSESGKPAGLVFFAAASRTGKKIAHKSMFRGVGRSLVRRKSVLQALAMMQKLASKERSAS